MSSKIRAACIVAHPDDETIFFGGLLQSFKYDWTVICVTNGNADGLGKKRRGDFARACRALKIKKFECWDFPDKFSKRLDLKKLEGRLEALGRFDKVFTHGPLGEYGHPHHQDVCFAVHEVFQKRSKVYSVAYNTFPEFTVKLTASQFKRKSQILWDIYSSEIVRFLHLLPATSTEGFTRYSKSEVDALYVWLTKSKSPRPRELKHLRWLYFYLKQTRKSLSQPKRVF